MPDCHEDALCEEQVAWAQLAALAREQRQALLGRDVARIDELRDQLQTRLGAALAARQRSLDSRGETPSPRQRQADDTLRQAHDAVHLNLELLRDVCSYLQMLRVAMTRDGTTTAYGQGRMACAPAYGKSRVA